jgi:PPOX class probable F420-dependent enzyme
MADSTSDRDLPQGDLRLLHDPIARRLLESRELGRLAYVAKDGTPRVIPIGWLWTGTDFLFATFGGSPKLASLRRRPAVALTIDRAGPPPEVLSVRGTATVADVDGVPDEYRQMQAKYYGEEAAEAVVAAIRQAGAPMAVVTIRPTWVATMDFQTRFPSGLVDAGLTG